MPRPNPPPSTICKPDAASSASDGTRMLPVPRMIEASVFKSHVRTAPLSAILA